MKDTTPPNNDAIILHIKMKTAQERKKHSIACPVCGGITEYNAYYERYTCTRCNYESKKIPKTPPIKFHVEIKKQQEE